MRAPLAGVVVQKLVLPGQFIQAGMTAAFVISNTATVWVQGHVYDKDLSSVHVGDKVDERNASFPETFHGVVAYIGDLIDPATRTTSVRIVTQNTGGLLKKDLFVDVVIHDKTTRDVLAVPTTAVLYDEQNFPFVYVQMAPGKFAQRLVKIGGQQGDDDARSWTASRRAIRSSPRAASSCSLRTPTSSNAMINRLVSFALVAALHRHGGDAVSGGLGRRLVPKPADRRLPGSVAADGADRDAVAGPRGRRDRAAHHDPARGRDERHPEARRACDRSRCTGCRRSR